MLVCTSPYHLLAYSTLLYISHASTSDSLHCISMCTCTVHYTGIILMECLSDIDQWNKVCQILGTPPREFFKQLQPSVSLHCVYLLCVYSTPSVLFLYASFYFRYEVHVYTCCMYRSRVHVGSMPSCSIYRLLYLHVNIKMHVKQRNVIHVTTETYTCVHVYVHVHHSTITGLPQVVARLISMLYHHQQSIS